MSSKDRWQITDRNKDAMLDGLKAMAKQSLRINEMQLSPPSLAPRRRLVEVRP